jgi:hypothetical protein
MAMQRIMAVQLGSREVRLACEEYVGRKMKDDTLAFTAAVADDCPQITVEVTRKRVRKPRKSKAVEARQAEVRG